MNEALKRQEAKLDALDRRILHVLQSNNLLGAHALAALVNSSAPTCLRRIKRLRETGVIARECAQLDPFRIGRSLVVFVHVILEQQSERTQRDFERRMKDEPRVMQCYMVSGEVDFVLIVNVADMHEYHDFARNCLAADINVRNFRSMFAMNRSKFETAIPMFVNSDDAVELLL